MSDTAKPDKTQRESEARRTRLILPALFVVGLIVRVVQAAQLHFPPLDDPAYYLKAAENVVAGRGLSIAAAWNYVPQPTATGLRPAFDYWMPLSSFAMIPLLWLSGGAYLAAQVPSLVAGASLAPLAYLFGRRVLPSHLLSIASGVVTAFSPLLVYQSALPDSAMLYAAFAAAALLVWDRVLPDSPDGSPQSRSRLSLPSFLFLLRDMSYSNWWLRPLMAGGLAGLAFLTRTPAVFILAAWLCGIFVLQGQRFSQYASTSKLRLCGYSSRFVRQELVLQAIRDMGIVLIGFAIVVGPWLLRNLLIFGFLTSPAGLQTLFITDYADLFAYGGPTTPGDLIAQAGGIGPLLAERGNALASMWNSLGTFFWPSGLLPLIGGVLLWPQHRARVPLLYCLFLSIGLPLVFGVASENGSFYHSAGSMAPFLVPASIYAVYRIGMLLRRFGPARTMQKRGRQLGSALVGALILLNLALLLPTISSTIARHTAEEEQYRRVNLWLHDHPAHAVVANEPSTLNYVSDLPALRLPANQDAATLRRLMTHYNADYVIITASTGRYPDELHARPDLFRLVYHDPGDPATNAGEFEIYAPL